MSASITPPATVPPSPALEEKPLIIDTKPAVAEASPAAAAPADENGALKQDKPEQSSEQQQQQQQQPAANGQQQPPSAVQPSPMGSNFLELFGGDPIDENVLREYSKDAYSTAYGPPDVPPENYMYFATSPATSPFMKYHQSHMQQQQVHPAGHYAHPQQQMHPQYTIHHVAYHPHHAPPVSPQHQQPQQQQQQQPGQAQQPPTPQQPPYPHEGGSNAPTPTQQRPASQLPVTPSQSPQTTPQMTSLDDAQTPEQQQIPTTLQRRPDGIVEYPPPYYPPSQFDTKEHHGQMIYLPPPQQQPPSGTNGAPLPRHPFFAAPPPNHPHYQQHHMMTSYVGIVPQHHPHYQQHPHAHHLHPYGDPLATPPHNDHAGVPVSRARKTAGSTLKSSRESTSRKLFQCMEENCGKEFKRSEHLKRHMRTHTGERPFQCPYAECAKRFSRSDNLTQHIRIHKADRPTSRTSKASKAAASNTMDEAMDGTQMDGGAVTTSLEAIGHLQPATDDQLASSSSTTTDNNNSTFHLGHPVMHGMEPPVPAAE